LHDDAMKTAKIITDTQELAFQRFKDAVRHIASVPKSKLVELEKKNGHRTKNHTKKNGHQ
jgi:hypothetical protein